MFSEFGTALVGKAGTSVYNLPPELKQLGFWLPKWDPGRAPDSILLISRFWYHSHAELLFYWFQGVQNRFRIDKNRYKNQALKQQSKKHTQNKGFKLSPPHRAHREYTTHHFFQQIIDFSIIPGLFEIWTFGYAENVPMDIPRFQFSNFKIWEIRQ